MFFRVDDVEFVFIAAAVIIGGVFLVRFTRKKQIWVRIVAWFSGLSMGGIAALFLLSFYLELIAGCNTHGKPIYSPDHKAAALIWTQDAGATGGGTSVSVYTARGFRSSRIFSGNWLSVTDQDVVWNDDSHLTIRYPSNWGHPECKNAQSIEVTCISQQTQTPRPKGVPLT